MQLRKLLDFFEVCPAWKQLASQHNTFQGVVDFIQRFPWTAVSYATPNGKRPRRVRKVWTREEARAFLRVMFEHVKELDPKTAKLVANCNTELEVGNLPLTPREVELFKIFWENIEAVEAFDR